jgi:hypothetical protein
MSTLNIVVCDDCGGRTLPPGPGSVVQEWLDTPELGPDDEDEDDEDDDEEDDDDPPPASPGVPATIVCGVT